MRRVPCLNCGTPTSPGPRCHQHAHPTGSATARGYGATHRKATAAAVAAEPWCHTAGGCPWPDSATATNPLTGGHPLTIDDLHGDRQAWATQQVVPQCHRCNSGHYPLI